MVQVRHHLQAHRILFAPCRYCTLHGSCSRAHLFRLQFSDSSQVKACCYNVRILQCALEVRLYYSLL
jgi:hypothetical protein